MSEQHFSFCKLTAKKHQHDMGPRGEAARGYLDGLGDVDPREETEAYNQGWLDGAGDRLFLEFQGRMVA